MNTASIPRESGSSSIGQMYTVLLTDVRTSIRFYDIMPRASLHTLTYIRHDLLKGVESQRVC